MPCQSVSHSENPPRVVEPTPVAAVFATSPAVWIPTWAVVCATVLAVSVVRNKVDTSLIKTCVDSHCTPIFTIAFKILVKIVHPISRSAWPHVLVLVINPVIPLDMLLTAVLNTVANDVAICVAQLPHSFRSFVNVAVNCCPKLVWSGP